MTLSEAQKQLILQGPVPQAEQALAAALAADAFDPAGFGVLAAGLVGGERHALAAMIFAQWTAVDPANPEPWSNLGLCLSRSHQLQAAREVLEHALSLNPDYAPARNNLSSVYQFLGDIDRQLSNATEAARLQPGSALAKNNLGTALMEHGRLAEAKQAFEASRRLDPGNFEAGFNLARVASDEGRHAEALAFLEAALAGPAGRLRHLRDMIEYHLSYEYLVTGRLAEGWDFYERGFSPAIAPTIARLPARRFTVPEWDGRPLARGQKLMIWREQGIGDELRFAALLPLLALGEGDAVVECDARLVPAFTRSLPHLHFRAPRVGNTDGVESAPADVDFHLPVGSLPRLYLRSAASFDRLGTLLKPDPALMQSFAERLAATGGKRRVGICWRSSLLSGKRNKKYTTLDDWRSLLSDPDSVFVNLQYGECEAELVQIEQALGMTILRWPDVDLKGDLEAVMALASQLDLVISASTAVVPLAGAVGAPTLLLAHQTWVTLGETDRYPWFPSVTPIFAAPDANVAAALPRAAEAMRRSPMPSRGRTG